MADLFDWLISVDDHVVEPPNLWQDRLPAKYRDVGPRVVRDSVGEAWVYEDTRNPIPHVMVSAGDKSIKGEDFNPAPISYDEMRPGCYEPKARVEDMNRDGVLSSLCFPTVPRFCGQMFSESKDKELGLLSLKAYNDWMIEEWSGGAPGRFIPMIVLPLWDPRLAAKEIERCAGLGAKAIAFSENPYQLGFPSIHDRDRYWDPVWAAAQEAGLPICCHIGSSSKMPSTAPDAPFLVTVTLTPMNAAWTCVDWLFSGIFIRFPRLKLCLSEGGIGWIPYILERCERCLDRQGWSAKKDFNFAKTDLGLETVVRESNRTDNFSIPPAELFRDHVYGCFIDDEHGAQSIDFIGVDNIMIETDYPHIDSSWPDSRENARKRLAGRSDADVEKILRSNAKRVFNFEPAPPPGA